MRAAAQEQDPIPPSDRRTTILFFGAVTLLYLSLSPFTVSAMGYAAEEMQACRQLLSRLEPGTPAASVDWPRNGGIGLVFECPFLAISHRLAGPDVAWEDRILALAPVLSSALLVTLLFVWCSRLAGSRLWGLLLALTAGFCTLIWPYAYIGLETTQSLFLLLAGFLALGSAAPRTWPRCILFALCSAIALSAKSGGFLLAPAIATLAWQFFRSERTDRRTSRALASRAVVVIALIATIFAVNTHLRALSWARFGGTVSFVRAWLVHDPVSPFLNVVALLGSPNKGLLVFAPVTILALVAMPRAFAENRSVALFALLTLAGLGGGLALLEMWSDETWGPRYLHSCIGPLVLCLAAARKDRLFQVRREIPLLTAAVLGFGVSVLGSLFYYGSLTGVAAETTPLTLEALQGDPTWNHVAFNARLLDVWIRLQRGHANDPEFLKPGRPWDFRNAGKIAAWKAVDLRSLAQPQPLMIREWRQRTGGVDRALKGFCEACFALGLFLLLWTGRSVLRT